jgi:hypothetical protein
MKMNKIAVAIAGLLIIFSFPLGATKLLKVGVVDKDYLMIRFIDGQVSFIDDGLGEGAFETRNDAQNNVVIAYGVPLNTANASLPENWTITSEDDPAYGSQGLHPIASYRKSKPNGMAQLEWQGNDYHYEYTMEHIIYLKLPKSMIQGKTYILQINPNTNTHLTSQSVTFDVFREQSEAIHVNLAGYPRGMGIKACDLYHWMGDGGARDYSALENSSAWLYNTRTKQQVQTSQVKFWQKSLREQDAYNQTASDVWNADFSGNVDDGTYAIVIDGVGCSEEFEISNDVYYEPFRVSVLGFFYMRIGQDNPEMVPVPRRPLYIPVKSPENTSILLTTMHPYHPDWKTFSRGDVWDRPEDWVKYIKPNSANNTVATGGHSDALDWDRHLGHVSIIYDMLLPFILTHGVISNDNLGIAESGNNIPDILDEARNEVDFWLRLRDGIGYSHGLTNPDRQNRMYQAENTAMAAWANAANCAMLSQCFQIAGLNTLMETYRDSAMNAYSFASSLTDQMPDKSQNVGDINLTGMEFRLIAAAYLYNVTGNRAYESDINKGSRVKSKNDMILGKGRNELWSAAGYLTTRQKVHFPALYNNLKASLINEAKTNEANYIMIRPSRRATDEATGHFKTEQNMHRTMIAHAVTTNMEEKAFFEKAMVLEADWGLGRNPLNIIQMTTATTRLADKRSIENAYTSGRDDGTAGMHPGHTPYLNTNDWGKGMAMHQPSSLHSKCYPEYSGWPQSEGYFNTRYVWAHSEFTPQQTMRGKTALYGYLYGICK